YNNMELLISDRVLTGIEVRQKMKNVAMASRLFMMKDDLIAGYHWFGPWTRDTMVSLPGILLTAGMHDVALVILSKYRSYLKNGLLPKNMENVNDFEAVDSSLWFIYAILKYYEYTADHSSIERLIPAIEDIINAYFTGNDLFCLDGPFVRTKKAGLTWMDAAHDGKYFTPRIGLPVEVNALWYNALMAYKFLCSSTGCNQKVKVDDTVASFSDLFYPTFVKNGHFLDVAAPDDTSFRPNFIFCFSLPFPCAENFHRYSARIDEELLTPYGLRTLSSKDKNFHPFYWGDRDERDSAYHNGTVWPWLVGPYVTASRRSGKSAKDIFDLFSPLINMQYIPEIFDGLNPSSPRGCLAQAWSYGELLRSWWEDIAGIKRQVDLS
ncbi:MAG: amylo-alpha-1,6-glucosidase, partial [Thermoplasmataceae archaeon]